VEHKLFFGERSLLLGGQYSFLGENEVFPLYKKEGIEVFSEAVQKRAWHFSGRCLSKRERAHGVLKG